MKEKFVSQGDHKLICRYSKCGPIFGDGHDIYISNECNKNNNSYANFSVTYNRGGGSKLERKQESFRMFSGATSGNYFVV